MGQEVSLFSSVFRLAADRAVRKRKRRDRGLSRSSRSRTDSTCRVLRRPRTSRTACSSRPPGPHLPADPLPSAAPATRPRNPLNAPTGTRSPLPWSTSRPAGYCSAATQAGSGE